MTKQELLAIAKDTRSPDDRLSALPLPPGCDDVTAKAALRCIAEMDLELAEWQWDFYDDKESL